SHPVPGGDDCTSITFSRGTLLAAVGHWDPSCQDHPESPFRFTHGSLAPRTLVRLQRLRRRLRRGTPNLLQADESALDLLHEVLSVTYETRQMRRRPHRSDTVLAYRDQVEAAKQILAREVASKLSLAQIAAQVHAS